MLEKNTSMESISRRIEVRKAELGLSNIQIATACDVSTRTVINWTSGLSSPHISKLVPLSFVLKKEINWIISGSNDISDWLGVTMSDVIEFHQQLSKYSKSERTMLFKSISSLIQQFGFILKTKGTK
ncbi:MULTISPECIES: helix-turn-helix domain-containing protein [unclassified Aliivibrio]|uniref:helix-turn-helix domain-containing protein n=1 Tax=unclassified Aliivibrio TaxID=2645654 RepID=UPI00080E765A|nr:MULTISPECIES: helix-turn-helix domain-containing protein [unclassified Aliivibrio]OCH13591.1 transcriptional regulator [Aliivibrio sp. 1S165]OCH23646.1 transcriptional regulator [Aliivibrio sp. 1S128]OCH31766.1 transcriptional regulator [Aliivibrio sp. 1S175]